MELKERITLVSMPMAFDKCVKFDKKEESGIRRAIPLPDEIIPIVKRALTNITMKCLRTTSTLDELKSKFVTESLDGIFYQTDDKMGMTTEIRYSRDEFINHIDELQDILNFIWDNIYKLTEKVLEGTNSFDKAKEYFKDYE